MELNSKLELFISIFISIKTEKDLDVALIDTMKGRAMESLPLFGKVFLFDIFCCQNTGMS